MQDSVDKLIQVIQPRTMSFNPLQRGQACTRLAGTGCLLLILTVLLLILALCSL